MSIENLQELEDENEDGIAMEDSGMVRHQDAENEALSKEWEHSES